MAETIRIETDVRGVATLWMARPEKHNALSAQLIAELGEAAKTLAADAAVRVVVLAGDGKSFCAGGDLNWMQAQMSADRETRAREARALAQMLFDFNTLPKPLIGLIPATIGPYVIARMGEAKARRVFMSSRLFDAGEAVALDLASRSVPVADLEAAVEAEVAPYLNCAPGAVAAAKALARRMGPVIDEAAIDASIDALIAQWEGDEAPEGVAAFFDKRPPRWAQG